MPAMLFSCPGTIYFVAGEDLDEKRIAGANGQIVEQGGRDEIFGAPKQAYTKRLLTSVPQMDPEWLTEARARERSLREAE